MKERLRGERQSTCPTERLPKPREHREVGVKRDLLQAPHAERGEAVPVFQVPNSHFL
jgi:hypothetical protein